MEITVELSDTGMVRLKKRAAKLNVSERDMAAKLLSDSLVHQVDGSEKTSVDDDPPSLEEVVAHIKATPRNPDTVIPATKKIDQIDLLRRAFDNRGSNIAPGEWDRLWADFEEQLKAIDQADDIAEGRI